MMYGSYFTGRGIPFVKLIPRSKSSTPDRMVIHATRKTHELCVDVRVR